MINKENLKDLLKTLNFEEKGKVFSKHFPDTDAYLKVDFAKSLLVYPTDKGFVVNGEFTCNFTSDENFVVFECVHRLFTKGYKPEHIELEPKWKVGHGASGGRAEPNDVRNKKTRIQYMSVICLKEFILLIFY